ncbi:MAG TPA: glutathione S-transferase N-terminal domain-containing protein [Candidatus Binataceae bacterium]|nr:glutathione S-transferase N-terminal domain-containing protein [Candidatus Binataceae bacterium]
MILVGQYDSPYSRRVAISLMVLGIAYEHDTRSVFGDFDSMRRTNPLARIPSLILDDGTVLVDSAAILDWIDGSVGAERALIPPSGLARRDALQRIALANGAVDKIGGGRNYETLIRPSRYRWPEWIERTTTQGLGALEALNACDWPAAAPVDQAQITTGCAIDYVKVTASELMPEGRFPVLDALWRRLAARPEFRATSFSDYKVPRAD